MKFKILIKFKETFDTFFEIRTSKLLWLKEMSLVSLERKLISKIFL